MNNTLCSAAWTDMNIDFSRRTVRHCCKSLEIPFPETLTVDFFNNSDRINRKRKDLIDGIQTPDCICCWDDYKLTGNAYRDVKNEWDSVRKVNSHIGYIEIFLDNLCDMSCIYCDEIASSKIASEKKIKSIKNLRLEDDLNVFVSFLESVLKTQSHINLSFLGGEVTYSKKFFYFVNRLLENKILRHSAIYFSILTNGNSSDDAIKNTIELFDSMPSNWHVNVSMSNEASGKAAELVRYGLSWERFLKNFEIYVNHQRVGSIVISPTLTIFTVKHFPSFVKSLCEYLKSNGNNKTFKIIGNWVVFPDFFNPVYADVKHKHLINELKQYVSQCNVIKNSKDFLIFLDNLENRIGSLTLNAEELDEFLETLAKQKSDNNIWKLKDLL